MAQINSLNIDTSKISATGETRSLSITGEVGASFTIQIANSAGAYHNFQEQLFSGGIGSGTSAFSTKCIFNAVLVSNTFTKSIYFPPATGVTYNIVLIPNPGTTISNNRNIINKSIETVANTIVTFAVGTVNTNSYTTSPAASSITSIGSSSGGSSTVVPLSYTVNNSTSENYAYGLRHTIPNNFHGSVGFGTEADNSTHFYFTTTEAVADNPAGDGEDSTTVTVASLTDIGVGMTLYYHKGTTVPTNKAGSAVGTTVITDINTTTKTITFSKAVAFEDTETMTFRMYGLSDISTLLNCGIELSAASATPSLGVPKDGVVTTQVRGAVSSSTTITCTTTQGISGGSIIGFTGAFVDNSSTNDVNAVTQDPDGSDGDGSFTCDVAQTLKAGTVLSFESKLIATKISLLTNLLITKYPTSNRIIYLDLDRFITPGTAS